MALIDIDGLVLQTLNVMGRERSSPVIGVLERKKGWKGYAFNGRAYTVSVYLFLLRRLHFYLARSHSSLLLHYACCHEGHPSGPDRLLIHRDADLLIIREHSQIPQLIGCFLIGRTRPDRHWLLAKAGAGSSYSRAGE